MNIEKPAGDPGDEVVITGELDRRPSRPPDYEAENRALVALAQELAASPSTVLQKLAELVLDLCRSGSAGVNILQEDVLRWPAIAGPFAVNIGWTMPAHASAGGAVIDTGSVLLVNRAERIYPSMRGLEPPIYESLLVPFHADGKPVGTIWAIAHDPERKFDAEDVRLLTSLSRFATAAYRTIAALERAEADRRDLERCVEERTHALSQANIQAQTALRENEARFRQFVENSSDVLWIVDARSRRLEYLSPAYERIWGEPRERIMADLSRWVELLHPDDREKALEGMPRLLAGEALTKEYRIVRRSDGAVRWIQDAGFPIRDESGQVHRVAGIAQDVTDRKEIEARLRESEERYRLIIEGALDYGIFTVDPEGIIESWSPGAAAVYGWPTEQAIGQKTAVLFVPEDRAKGEPEKELAEARDKGAAPDVRWHLRKDGSRVFIEGTTRALRDATGALRGFFKIGQDVTERRQAEAALRESEERFRTLATHIPQLVFRSLGTGERTWGSPQWEGFTGLSDLRSRGLGWLDAIHPEDRAATIAAWREAQAQGEYYVEHRVLNQDGNYRWHQTRAAPLRDRTGRILEWLGTSADIHDLRQLQERQSVLVAELQHRTRNLLAVVQSVMLQTIETSLSLEDFGQRFGDRLAALGRAQGLLARDGQAVTIGKLLHVELSAHGAEPDGNRVTLDGPAVELPRKAVQTLALAVHELATNAVKYGALSIPSGRLSVAWTLRDGNGGTGRRLALDWREGGVVLKDLETGAPRRGYGRELIEEALPYELDAETRLDFTEEGVRCRIELPLE